jgi:hypothetical protein
MSAENVYTILQRAVNEPEFRGLLFRSPDQALAGYELGEAEAAALRGLTPENFDTLRGDLEQRLSHLMATSYLLPGAG